MPAFVSAVFGHRPVGIYGDVRHSQADGRRLRELFPDIPPNDFAGGLAVTVDWMKSSLRWARTPDVSVVARRGRKP